MLLSIYQHDYFVSALFTALENDNIVKISNRLFRKKKVVYSRCRISLHYFSSVHHQAVARNWEIV